MCRSMLLRQHTKYTVLTSKPTQDHSQPLKRYQASMTPGYGQPANHGFMENHVC